MGSRQRRASGSSPSASSRRPKRRSHTRAEKASAPTAYTLHANYPNPFSSSTEIRFDLPEDAEVQLVVYDLLGREVARLVDAPMSAGAHSVTLDAGRLPSGTYLYRIEAGPYTAASRMVLLK